MKRNRWLKKRVFFIAATVSLGAGYFLFEYVDENPPVFNQIALSDEEPDYYGKQLSHRQYSSTGTLSQEFSAAASEHFPLAAITHFVKPHIIVTSEDGQRWQIDSKLGQSQDIKHLVTLSQQVEVRPLAPQANEDLLVETDVLHYHTDSQIAETEKPVKITRANALINSKGMSLSIPTQILTLNHQVNTRYVPPSTE